MNEYPQKLKDIVDVLSSLPEHDRIEMLLDFASKYKAVPEEIASPPYPEDNKAQMCESNAFVWSTLDSSNKINFHFAVENPQGLSARAFVVILQRNLNGESPQLIQNIPNEIITKIFSESLSIRKNIGLTNILQKVQQEAKKYI